MNKYYTVLSTILELNKQKIKYGVGRQSNFYQRIKQKLKREHYLKGTLRKQSNKHQNSQKPMQEAENKKLPVAACLGPFSILV